MCRVCAGAVFLLLTLVVCGQVTGSDVRAVPCIIGAPGQTGESAIILDQVSQGLSEFEIQVLLLDPAIGEITAVRFRVPSGAVNVLFVKFTIAPFANFVPDRENGTVEFRDPLVGATELIVG